MNVTTIAATLEEKHAGLAAALPGLNTFTGCDFTASFFHKGKVNPYEIFEKDTTGTFISFFQSWTLRDEPDQKISEAYVHSLYGMDEVKDIDEGRYKKIVRVTGKLSKVIVTHIVTYISYEI